MRNAAYYINPRFFCCCCRRSEKVNPEPTPDEGAAVIPILPRKLETIREGASQAAPGAPPNDTYPALLAPIRRGDSTTSAMAATERNPDTARSNPGPVQATGSVTTSARLELTPPTAGSATTQARLMPPPAIRARREHRATTVTGISPPSTFPFTITPSTATPGTTITPGTNAVSPVTARRTAGSSSRTRTRDTTASHHSPSARMRTR